ncbi:MBL fold metallo-hydrolase [Peribacillus sp. SCS-37]|uniref:MBL fold metallo-hydrolase n=1 Tax=Paraperibacillus esterisolvens TaxID=3115296 RepID=UPI003905BFD7
MSHAVNTIVKIPLPTPFAVGDVHAYLLKGDVLTLVDTGTNTNESKHALQQGLLSEGFQLSDIEQVIITHHHPDHAGGAGFLPAHVPYLGHEANQRWLLLQDDFIREHDEFFLGLARELGVPVEYIGFIKYLRGSLKFASNRPLTGFLKDGSELPGHPGWTVVETLGHAQSHISLYHEQNGYMIGGDHLLARISPNPLIEPPKEKGGERPKSLLQYNQSIKELSEMPISHVYPGHGENISDTAALIKRNLDRQHDRAMTVKSMIASKASTAFEICTLLFPKVFLKEPGLTLSETVGQLDYLLAAGEIHEEETDSGIIYKTGRARG